MKDTSKDQARKSFRQRMLDLKEFRQRNPGGSYLQFKNGKAAEDLDAVTGASKSVQPSRVFDKSDSVFDPNKVYNRVPARAWGPSSMTDRLVQGPLSAAYYYHFKDDNTAQRYVDEAHRILNDPEYRTQPARQKDAMSYLAHEDAKAFYLGMPQRTGLIEESPHVPSDSKGDMQYYRFKHQSPEYWDDAIQKLLVDKVEQPSKRLSDKTLSTYKASIGTNRMKGEYASIYDIWDYNTDVIGSPGDNIGKYVGGQPFEIYDRVYLDDVYGVSSAPQAGDFYGGYLPEVHVSAKKK